MSEQTLALLAAERGTVGRPPAGWEDLEPLELELARKRGEVESADEAAEREEEERASQARKLREQRNKVRGVLHKLSPEDADLVYRIQGGQGYAEIAAALEVTRATIRGRYFSIVQRIQHWLGLPVRLPDGDELREHLAESVGLPGVQPGRLQRYLDGVSLRDIADQDGRTHQTVLRGIQRSMKRIEARRESCPTCSAIVVAFERRRDYRPSTAQTRVEAEPLARALLWDQLAEGGR